MAFPTIVSETSGTTAAATSHAVSLPATVNANNKLLVAVVINGNQTIGFPGGWTLVEGLAAAQLSAAIYEKTATGSEDGTTITVTCTSSEACAFASWAIADAGTISAAAEATGSSTTPNPPSHNPAWGSEDTLYFAIAASDNNTSFSGYPSTYTGTGTRLAGAGGSAVAIGFARKEVTADSEDPGTFSISGSAVWAAWTVAVRYSASSATLTDVDTDETITTGQTGIAYTGTGLTDADGLVVTFAAREAAATAFSATNATSGTFTAPSLSAVLAAGVKFGSVTFQIEDGGVSLATLAGTLNPESGWQVHNVTDISQAADTGCIYNGQSPAVAVGDQILFESTGVTIDSQGFVALDGVSQFDYYVWDDTDDTWGAMGTFSGVGSGDALLRPILRPALLPIMKPILH